MARPSEALLRWRSHRAPDPRPRAGPRGGPPVESPALCGIRRTWRPHSMRVLLSSWGSRGDIEPLAALALRLRELGAEVRVCAPPDEEFVELFARVGVMLTPLGPSTRSIAAGLKAPLPDAAFRLAAELVAARFAT